MPTNVLNKANVEIRISMRVSLEIQLKNDVDGMPNVLTLSSVVEEIRDDRIMLIHMPLHQGYHYPLSRDNPIFMHFAVDLEMYKLLVQFEERIERGGFIYAKMRQIGKIKPHLRRDCYRLPYSQPVIVERLWLNEREIYPERQPTEGRMINLSDGGMLFATDENIEKDEKITLTFDIGKPEIVECKALRTERIEDGKYLFRVAVRFKNKDKAQKERLYKYILDKQLEERRRWMQDTQPLFPAETV